MGSLRITDTGIRVEGQSDFIGPLYADSISTDEVQKKISTFDCIYIKHFYHLLLNILTVCPTVAICTTFS